MKELRGNLSNTALPELLHIIYSRGDRAGVLEIDRAPVKRRFFFEEGVPVFATSNILNEVLGRVLLQEGVITREDYERSLEIVLKERKKHGEVLVELGLVTPEEVDNFLALQLKLRLLNAFGWREGSYTYNPKETLAEGIPRFPIHPASVILEGISKGFYPEAMLKAALQDYMDKALVCSEETGRYSIDDFGLNLQEKRFYESFDGSRPLEKILEESFLLRHRAESLILTFIITGLLKEARPVADESGLILRLNDELARLASLDRFSVFSLSGEEELERLEEAYRQLSKKYRPELFRGAGPEVKELADEIRGVIEGAYQELKSLKQERARAEGVAAAEAQRTDTAYDARVNAEILFMKAKTALEERNYERGVETLREIVRLNPGEAEYMAYLGWALYCRNPDDREEAESLLKKAIETNRELDTAWYLLGRLYISSGNPGDGERALRTALGKNPWMAEALYELKRLEITRGAQKEAAAAGYIESFGFTKDPFESATPPREPYRHGAWQQVFGSLLKALEEGSGPLMVTGPVGVGKTLMALELLKKLSGRKFLTALVIDPPNDELSLIKAINNELSNTTSSDSLKEQVHSLNQRIELNKSQKGRTLLIIDEAQKAEFAGLKLLEQLSRNRDLQVVLLVDVGLCELLREPWLKELDRRITNRLELKPLGPEDTAGYIKKRLDDATGNRAQSPVTFTPGAVEKIHEKSQGLPLVINTQCRGALDRASVIGVSTIDEDLVEGIEEAEPLGEAAGVSGEVLEEETGAQAQPAGVPETGPEKEAPGAPRVVKIMKEPEPKSSKGLLTILLIALAMAAIGLVLGSLAGLF